MIVEFSDGTKFEIREDGWYSLNYAISGMSGCALDKKVPDHLVTELEARYKRHKAFTDKHDLKASQKKPEKIVEAKPVATIVIEKDKHSVISAEQVKKIGKAGVKLFNR